MAEALIYPEIVAVDKEFMMQMASGNVYDDFDIRLGKRRTYANKIISIYASLFKEGNNEEARESLKRLVKRVGERVNIIPPFSMEFGMFVEFGDDVFINQDSIFLDCAPVIIGNRVMMGPRVCFFTSDHDLDPIKRNKGDITAKPITINDDVWIGGNVTFLGGVTVGEGSTIGAGSVVISDIPAGVVAVGNPCRVVKVL